MSASGHRPRRRTTLSQEEPRSRQGRVGWTSNRNSLVECGKSKGESACGSGFCSKGTCFSFSVQGGVPWLHLPVAAREVEGLGSRGFVSKRDMHTQKSSKLSGSAKVSLAKPQNKGYPTIIQLPCLKLTRTMIEMPVLLLFRAYQP